jgi:hypothetical protein
MQDHQDEASGASHRPHGKASRPSPPPARASPDDAGRIGRQEIDVVLSQAKFLSFRANRAHFAGQSPDCAPESGSQRIDRRFRSPSADRFAKPPGGLQVEAATEFIRVYEATLRRQRPRSAAEISLLA